MNDLKFIKNEVKKTKVQASEQRHARGDAGGLPDGRPLDKWRTGWSHRVETFKQLLELGERYKHVNQYH